MSTTRPSRVENVALDQPVVITMQSDSDEEYHLHGYDLEQKAAAGTEASFSSPPTMPGDFELESHTTDQVLRRRSTSSVSSPSQGGVGRWLG